MNDKPVTSAPSDQELLQGIRSDAPGSVRLMWQKYQEFRSTVAHLRHLGAEADDARYCTDLAVAKLVHKIQQGFEFDDRSEGCIGRWVNQSAEWNLQDWWRQKARYDRLVLPGDENTPAMQQADTTAMKWQHLNESIEEIRMHMARLPQPCQGYIYKRYVEEVELEEFLTLFPTLTTLDSVKNSISKCLKKLKAMVLQANKS